MLICLSQEGAMVLSKIINNGYQKMIYTIHDHNHQGGWGQKGEQARTSMNQSHGEKVGRKNWTAGLGVFFLWNTFSL